MAEPSSECVDAVITVAGDDEKAPVWTANILLTPDGSGVNERHVATSKGALWKRVEARLAELARAERRPEKVRVRTSGVEMWVSADDGSGGDAGPARTEERTVRTWYARSHVYGRSTRGRPRSVYHHHPSIKLIDDDLEDTFRTM